MRGDRNITFLAYSGCFARTYLHSTLLLLQKRNTKVWPSNIVGNVRSSAMFAYFIIAKRQQLRHRIPQQQQAARRANVNRDNRRGSTALKVILFVAFFFIFCYSLEVYYAMCKHVLKLCEDTEILQMIRRLLLIANSAINPFAYAFLKRDIKMEVKKICAFCRKRKMEVNMQLNSETNLGVSLVSVLDTRL